MSHTTTLRGVQIKSATAIEAAVKELIDSGIKIELLKNTTPRMYYSHQAAAVGKCEYVLKLPGSRYDVGLKWNAEAGQYDAIMDIHAGDIANQIGATCPLPMGEYGRAGEHAIGRFTQRYGINAAKEQARAMMRENFNITFTEVAAPNGDIHLEINGL